MKSADVTAAVPARPSAPPDTPSAAEIAVKLAVLSAETETEDFLSAVPVIVVFFPIYACAFLSMTSTAAESPAPTEPSSEAPAAPLPVASVVVSFAETDTVPASVSFVSAALSSSSPMKAFVSVVTSCAPAAPAPPFWRPSPAAAATDVIFSRDSAFTVTFPGLESVSPLFMPAYVWPVYF